VRERVARRRIGGGLGIALGLATSLLFLGLVLRDFEWGETLRHLGGVRLGVIPLVMAAKAVGFGFQTARTGVLVGSLAALSPLTLLRSVMLGFVGNNVLPLRTGELLRVGYLARRGSIPQSSCLAVVVVERLLDMLHAFGVLGVVLLAAAGRIPMTASVGIGAAGVGLAVIGSIAVGRRPALARALATRLEHFLGARLGGAVGHRVLRFADGLGCLASARSVVLASLCTTAYWTLTIASVQLWLYGFGLELPWHAALLVVAFLSFGVSLPSAPAHVGTYHFFAVGALAAYAVEPARAVSFAFVLHAMATVPFTVLGALLLLGEAFERDRSPGSRWVWRPEPPRP
jgi:hypothetical protein